LQMNSLYLLLAAFGLNQFINQRRPFNIVCDLRYTILKFCSHWVTTSSRYPKNGWKYFSSHSSLTASDAIVSYLNQEVYICTVHINFIDISNRESIPPRKPLFSLFTNALKKTKLNLSNFTFKYKNKF
jgi:hypothetical protein